jgi:diguanylate cyclase (GGDEF)-like protein
MASFSEKHFPPRRGFQLPAFMQRLIPGRAHTRDAFVIGVTSIAIMVLSVWLDVFEELHEFLEKYDAWQLDEIIVVMMVASIALLVFGYRRIRELRIEVKARGEAEAQAHRLARHDTLTGLPNRRCFSEKLEQALKTTIHDGARLAVLMLDLDGFKQINDVHGHPVGDQALIETAERIAAVTGDTLLARLGGDEFALIMPEIKSLEEPTKLARRIITAISEPFMIGSMTAHLSGGLGIAIAPDDGTEPDELLRRADRALYRAKAEGRATIRHFEASMDSHLERRMLIEQEMRGALKMHSIIPHYQPLVSLDGNRIIGFEALARWRHPTLGEVPPDVFIPVAEESGMIGALGDQLLRQACKDALHWPKDTILSFNISPVQLQDKTLGLRILAALGETGLDARRLELEITESAVVDHAGVAQVVIDQLRKAGVRIALDDFGTGYATLSQLMALHVDKLKIDRRFVDRLGKDNESAVIVRAIIGLANGFGLVTTAEGVEDKGQLAYLKENGCTEGQGYFFSKAVSAAEVPALLQQASTARRVA